MSKTYPKKIVIMPDYAPDAYAWDYETDDLITPIYDYFPANPDLIKIEEKLSSWVDWFDRGTSTGDNSNFPWDDFHKQGLDLAKQLAHILKAYDIEVYYWKPYEDSDGKKHRPVKVDPNVF